MNYSLHSLLKVLALLALLCGRPSRLLAAHWTAVLATEAEPPHSDGRDEAAELTAAVAAEVQLCC